MAGNQHYALAQLDEAYAHYNKAIDLDAQGQYYFNRGLVQSRRNKIEEAVDDYKKALETLTEPEYKYQAHFNKGIAFRRLGKLEASKGRQLQRLGLVHCCPATCRNHDIYHPGRQKTWIGKMVLSFVFTIHLLDWFFLLLYGLVD